MNTLHWSPYNFHFRTESNVGLIFNSLTCAFAELSDDLFRDLDRLVCGFISTDDLDPDVRNQLSQQGFLTVSSPDDVRLAIRNHHRFKQYNPTVRNITIVPTRDCNFRCSYCYESETIHPVYMSDEVEEKIISHLVKQWEDSGKTLHYRIAWYGGEPLLAWNRVQNISRALIAKGLNFDAELITNGYLLSRTISEELSELNIRSLQITIDGDRETHNQRRACADGKGTYDAIMNNLLVFSDVYSADENKVQLNLRVNVDMTNRGEYNKTRRVLNTLFPNAFVYPGIVRAERADVCATIKDCAMSGKLQADFYISQFRDEGNPDLNHFPQWFGIASCSATRLYDMIIGPEGELYRCWSELGISDYITGSLMDKSVGNAIRFNRYMAGIDPFDDPVCSKCFWLPVCGGGCPYHRLQNKYHQGTFETCVMHKGKRQLKKLLEIHYEKKKAWNEQQAENCSATA